jgi:hypothetical protein
MNNKENMRETIWHDLVQFQRKYPEDEVGFINELNFSNLMLHLMEVDLSKVNFSYYSTNRKFDLQFYQKFLGIKQKITDEVIRETHDFLVAYHTMPNNYERKLLDDCANEIDKWTQNHHRQMIIAFNPLNSMIELFNQSQHDLVFAYKRIESFEPYRDYSNRCYFTLKLAFQRWQNRPAFYDTNEEYENREYYQDLFRHYMGFLKSSKQVKDDRIGAKPPKKIEMVGDIERAKNYYHLFNFWLRKFSYGLKDNPKSRTPNSLKKLCFHLLKRHTSHCQTQLNAFQCGLSDFTDRWNTSIHDTARYLLDNDLNNVCNYEQVFEDQIRFLHPQITDEFTQELTDLIKENSALIE